MSSPVADKRNQIFNSIKSESGQEMVEYALIFPVLIVLIFGIVEFGLILMDYNTIANAAREGARSGIVGPNDSCDVACVEARVEAASRRLTSGLDQSSLTVAIQYPAANVIEVQVDYTAQIITAPIVNALGGPATIPLHAVASMQRE